MNSKVTIKTIAEEAGVSCGAISQVLANPKHPRFPSKTRERIIKAAKDLNYRPNKFAVGLRRQRVDLIVLIVPWNCPELVDTAETFSRQSGFQLMIEQTPAPTKGSEIKSLATALDWQPNGIIWMPYGSAEEYKDIVPQIKAWGGQMVLLHRGLSNLSKMDVVKPEGITRVREAVEHISAQGYQKIVYVSLPTTTELDQIRINTLRKTARQCNLEYDNIEIKFSMERKQCEKYLSQTSHTTAFVCQGDWHAVEILEASERLNMNCPNDIGIVSIGDFLLGNRLRICDVARPRITAIREPFGQIAQTAVRLLIDRITNETDSPARYIEVEENLIIRQSTLRKGVSK